MTKKLLALIVIFLVFTASITAQCAAFATNACTDNAPTVLGNTINCTPPLNDAGRRNFRVNNMVANATYRISNCGSGFDTQMTIRNLAGAVVGYNDDNGPACAGTAASIDFVPPADGDYRIQVNRYNCQSTGFLSNGTITVTLLSEPPLPCVFPTPITTPACPEIDVTPENSTISACSGSSTAIDLTATFTDLGDTSDYDVDLITYNQTAFNTFAAAATTTITLAADDRWSNVAYTIPFNFCFYENTVTDFVVGANGSISFDASLANTASGYSFGDNIPSTNGALIENAIFGVFHDIDPSEGGSISYGTTTANGCNVLVVLWDDIPMWNNANFGDNTKRHTAMILLYENTNIIEVHVEEKVLDDSSWNDGNALIGIQNIGATQAVAAPCRNSDDDNWETTNEAWRFTPSGGNSIANIQWLVNGTLDTNYDGLSTINVSPTTTTTYTAQLTYTRCDASTTTPITNDVIITVDGSKTWNGTINSDWEDANNWTPIGVPNNNHTIVIAATANNPIINETTDAYGCSLTIETGATLTQASNATLTINNEVTVQTGATYDMQNSASLIQINDVVNSVDGTFTMQRNTNIRINDYVYWSSPVTNFNIEDISPLTPNGFKYEWLPTTFQGIGPFGNMVFGEWQIANTGAMNAGKGYIIKGPTGHTIEPSIYTATFSGSPNNGTITQPIERNTYTGGNFTYQPNAGGDNILITNDDDNWNLVGNPYPSAINAISFLSNTNNSNIEGSVYLWTHGTDIGAENPDPFYDDYIYNYNVADYIAYNASGTSTPSGFNGNIAAGQGFFVLMNDDATTTESITFNNAMRSSAYANNQFYRNANSSDETNSNNHKIWLDYIAPTGQTNTTLLAYIDQATNEEDRMFDAATTTGNGLNLYSLINNDTYLIQGRQLPFNTLDQVPIGVNITQSGIQTIAINTLQGLFNDINQDIYIEDFITGTTHNLKNAPYTFTSDVGIVNDRFILKYTNTTLHIEDLDSLNGISVFEDNNKIVVKSELETITTIEVYDILGRTLFSNKSINTNRFYIESIKPSKATLLLKIELENGKHKIAKLIF